MIGRRLRVFGIVQGVFFRAWAREQARALGVRGWIRNRRDGSVELQAHGEDGPVEALIARCRQGPPAARVERVDVETIGAEGPQDFEIAPTA